MFLGRPKDPARERQAIYREKKKKMPHLLFCEKRVDPTLKPGPTGNDFKKKRGPGIFNSGQSTSASRSQEGPHTELRKSDSKKKKERRSKKKREEG